MNLSTLFESHPGQQAFNSPSESGFTLNDDSSEVDPQDLGASPLPDFGSNGAGASLIGGALMAAVDPGALKPSIAAIADRIAGREGVNPDALKRLIMIESSGNPNAGGTFKGLLQISDDIARRYGASNPFDPEQNITAALRNIKANVLPRMEKALGMAANQVPAIAVYLGHQQGMTGGPAIMAAALKGDTRPAWKVLQEGVNREIASYGGTGGMSDKAAQAAIRNNIPAEYPGDKNTISAVQFVNAWKNRMGEPAASTPFLKQ